VSKVWYITGAGRGFGKEFAKSALGRGDKVAATARSTDALGDLVAQFGENVLPLQLDVTDRDRVFATVTEAKEKFGRLDVVVNNAGYGLFGMVEEITPEQLQRQLDVNLFGVLHVTQAVLPILRAQGSGHIIQISTIGGVAAFPNLGGYHASKWALEGLTESLAQEVGQFGIKTTLVEPGGYATDWAGSSAVWASPLPQYEGIRRVMAERAGGGTAQSDPVNAGPAILDIVDAEQPPSRVFFGATPIRIVEPLYAKRLETWQEWQPTSLKADGR
jgi:NAD(P)-dependent dehydrogenase (short-subunit alcohol dehydrogenase family)